MSQEQGSNVDAREDLRGERRSLWECRVGLPPRTATVGGKIGAGPARVGCGAGIEHREELPDGRVYCARCGVVDQRSTRGNRRRARLELAALERRIERELHTINEHLEAVGRALHASGVQRPDFAGGGE